MAMLEELCEAVRSGNIEESKILTKRALDVDLDPIVVIEQGLAKGLRAVGEAFGRGEAFLTDLMFAAEAMKVSTSLVDPVLRSKHKQRQFRGTVLIGTVEGDIHDIGKSIVAATLEAHGFNVVDLGTDVPSTTFLEKATEMKPNILGMSALLSTTMPQQKTVIDGLVTQQLREMVKVMVGGAAVSPDWATEIGADAYGVDANDAAAKAIRLAGSSETFSSQYAQPQNDLDE
jgi:corrinoid protein of di/trimethylamine methyltransferase